MIRKPNTKKQIAFIDIALASNTDSCIIWPFSKINGYAYFYYRREKIRVAKLVCERVYGTPPEGKNLVLHRPLICHNPACINPKHLYWGNQKQNCLDKQSDGTAGKISKENRVQIAKSKNTYKEIAEAFGVSIAAVYFIKHKTSLIDINLETIKTRRPSPRVPKHIREQIKKAEGLVRDLALEFGVCEQTIYRIKRENFTNP